MDTTQTILSQVTGLSYLGLFTLSLLANIVIPVPEEVVIIAIGYAINKGVFSWWIAFPIVFFGSLLVDIVMYELSLHGNKLVGWVYEKYFSKLVPFSEGFIKSHLGKIVFVSRFLVQLRFLGPFYGGYFKMSRKDFIINNGFSLLLYLPLYLWFGAYFSSRIGAIVDGIGEVKNILLLLVALIALVGIMKSVKAFFLGTYRFGLRHHDGYVKTRIPGILKRSLSAPEKHFHIKLK